MRFIARALLPLCLLTTVISQAQTPRPSPFKHVVVIFQENRTPDNLFRELLAWPGVQIRFPAPGRALPMRNSST